MKYSDEHIHVLNAIPKAEHLAIQQPFLCKKTGLSPRKLKQYIVDLRAEYPIVSKKTQGGGYWIAQSELDVRRFKQMIRRRLDGYQATIDAMDRHLDNWGC